MAITSESRHVKNVANFEQLLNFIFLAIMFGLISHIERILITLILPIWTHDIPSFYHGLLIRKGISFKRNKLLN